MRFDEGKIVIEVELGNEAMSNPLAVANLLHQVASEISKMQDFTGDDEGDFDAGCVRRKFRDVNGNTVASWKHKS